MHTSVRTARKIITLKGEQMGWGDIDVKRRYGLVGIKFDANNTSNMSMALKNQLRYDQDYITFQIGEGGHEGKISFFTTDSPKRGTHKMSPNRTKNTCTFSCRNLSRKLSLHKVFVEFKKEGDRFIGNLPYSEEHLPEKIYGKELILDLHNCNSRMFTRGELKIFFKELCGLIKMDREDLHFWDYKDEPELYNKAPDHLKGTSAIQFIKTSNITVHTLDKLKKVYINIFSCKQFNIISASDFCTKFFKGYIEKSTEINRV